MKGRLELVFDVKVREIFDNFTSLFGIRIAYFGPDGEELEVGLDRPCCEYCLLLRHSLGDDEVRRASDSERQHEAALSRDLLSYRCHGGLFEAIKPLFVDSGLIGFVVIGQARTEGAVPEDKLGHWNSVYCDDRFQKPLQRFPSARPRNFRRSSCSFRP